MGYGVFDPCDSLAAIPRNAGGDARAPRVCRTLIGTRFAPWEREGPAVGWRTSMASKHRAEGVEKLREHLLELLGEGGAHIGFQAAVADLSGPLRGARPPGQSHTPWRLVEHLRIAQWDIVEFVRNPKHQSPPWPDGYWPQGAAPAKPKDWDHSVEEFQRDLAALRELVADTGQDLLLPLPQGQGQTLAREAMLAADHNAYHIGQLVMLRKILGAWKE